MKTKGQPERTSDSSREKARSQMVYTSEGQSNGVSRAFSKATQIKLVEEPGTDAIDIRADYVAMNSTPSSVGVDP